ncbi:hypothetical protein MGYG_08826 [Nannizzia gypsea CBS 118893]|uniref:Uncharacterized protein n=1 Tax=Arthroderma gypseum (strain ATCC MYA-4604 / CBS 118893) TaxID=535722 RepID=E4V737_ARTGP|nr:hypothetical protein MGYG_08826 [Nannizzia gypsea CBS 118893]EFQ96903.1 hypothetical protein MGYG_08826 [Nannizzia gypsea CBS 118893]
MPANTDEKDPGKVTVYTGAQRPDLLALTKRDDCPLIYMWPEFLDGAITTQRHFEKLYDLPEFAKCQLVAVHTLHGKETIVGNGNCIPFFWRELADIGNNSKASDFAAVLRTLPDGGFDTILARGVHQAVARKRKKKMEPVALTHDQVTDMDSWALTEAPNALSALAIAVLPAWRSYNVAEMLIKAMKDVAQAENLAILVVPLRPTRKAEFPHVDMAEYLGWSRQTEGPAGETSKDTVKNNTNGKPETAAAPIPVPEEDSAAFVPFDPWLRKHIRLGAKMVKIARQSMFIRGSAAEWKTWCDLDVRQRADKAVEQRKRVWVEAGSTEAPVIFTPSGCLAPMLYYPSRDVGEYCEPNVWLFHSLN